LPIGNAKKFRGSFVQWINIEKRLACTDLLMHVYHKEGHWSIENVAKVAVKLFKMKYITREITKMTDKNKVLTMLATILKIKNSRGIY